MFDWLGDFFDGIGDAIGGAFNGVGSAISEAIWEAMLQWYYETIYNAIADFFTLMGNMGADLFDLAWVQATINLFVLFGWALYVTGIIVAVFDVAIEYQSGRANIKTTALNILKGFFACSMIGVVPVELYKFCISLQNSLARDLSVITAQSQSQDLGISCMTILNSCFSIGVSNIGQLFMLLCMIAFAYCVNVQRSERISGRVQSVDQTGCGIVSDSFYADNSVISWLDDLSWQYAFGTWCNACGKRSAENCTAIWT